MRGANGFGCGEEDGHTDTGRWARQGKDVKVEGRGRSWLLPPHGSKELWMWYPAPKKLCPGKAFVATTCPFLRGRNISLRDEEENNQTAVRNKRIMRGSCSHEQRSKITQAYEQRALGARFQ